MIPLISHGGGADLRISSHTSKSSSQRRTGGLSNYWMHNGFVSIDDVKMSKSLGNFITVHDALKTIDGPGAAFLMRPSIIASVNF